MVKVNKLDEDILATYKTAISKVVKDAVTALNKAEEEYIIDKLIGGEL